MRYNFALSRVEKEVLYRKYVQNGLSSWDANNKVDEFVNYLDKMVKDLLKKNKTEQQIHQKFREEFELMCMKLEI